MTSNMKLEEIYADINGLLNDICDFLKQELKNGKLSPAAERAAKMLVDRSYKQVATISSVCSYSPMFGSDIKEDAEYVDPDHHSVQDDSMVDYDQVDTRFQTENLSNSSSLSTTTLKQLCPYSDMSPSQLFDKYRKAGPLYRKERYFIIEQKKNFFVLLVDYWLLIYPAGKKESKPLQIFDTTIYEARSRIQKKLPLFEIHNINYIGKKSIEFIARSEKDMEQWIVAINDKNTNELEENSLVIKLDKSTLSLASTEIGNISNYETQEKIYTEPYETNLPDSICTNSTNFNNIPSLPPRKPMSNVAKNPSVQNNDTSHYNNPPLLPFKICNQSLEDTYDEIQNSRITDAESAIYYDPRHEHEQDFEVEAEYDFIGEVSLPEPVHDSKNENVRIENNTDEFIQKNTRPEKPPVPVRLDMQKKNIVPTRIQSESEEHEKEETAKANSIKVIRSTKNIQNIIQEMEAKNFFKSNKN